MKIEKDWITKAGLRAVVLFNEHGEFRCGYVGVEKDSGYYGIQYNDISEHLSVHGGVTFSGPLNGLPKNIWWIGYDCAHSGDRIKNLREDGAVERSLEYCVDECESMARQLSYIPMKNYYYAISKGKLPKNMHKAMLLLSIQDPNDYFIRSYFDLTGKQNDQASKDMR
jgi:hypothetical protein